MTLVRVLIPWTVAIYLSFFLVYGEDVFDTDFSFGSSSDGFLDAIIDFFSDVVDFGQDLVQFVTLGGATSQLPGLLQAILLLSIGFGWFLVIIGIARGSPVS